MKRIYSLFISTLLTFSFASAQVNYGSCQTPTSGSPCFFGFYNFFIESVSFGSLNFSGGTCSGDGTDNGHQDLYGSVSGSVSAGNSYTLTIVRGGITPECWVVAWVDWNNDGDFSDAGEQLNTPQYLANVGGTTVVVTGVQVPPTAVAGDHRMRVRTDGGNPGSTPNPCDVTGSYGDTKDFKLVVTTGGGNCTNVGGSASANPHTICGGETSVLTLTGSTGTIQWQESIDGNSWGNVTTGSGATTSSYTTGPLTGSVYFRAVVSEPSCPDANSSAVQVTVNAAVVPSISIAATPSATICTGEPVTFSATIGNGGSSPIYDWKLNGNSVGNASTYSNSSLDSADVIVCELTSNALCVTNPTITSNTIEMIVNPIPDVSVSLPVTSVCQSGTPLTLSGGSPAGGVYSGTGVTGSNFDASQNEGDYVITYTYTAANCSNSAMDTLTIATCVSINDSKTADGFWVFPNPASESFSIHANGNISSVMLFSIQGQRVAYYPDLNPLQNTLTLPLKDLSKGMYILHAVQGGKTISRKLMVE